MATRRHLRGDEDIHYELFIDPKGSVGLARVKEDGEIGLYDYNEWAEDPRFVGSGKKGDEGIVYEKFPDWANPPWPLPGKPEYKFEELDEDLFSDLLKFVREHVWIQDERLYEAVVLWIIATWTNESNPVAPRLLAIAPTDCGKTRLLKVLRLTAYRPYIGIDVSKASIYHSIESYSMTLLIDEFQDLEREAKPPMNAIIKGGFESDCLVPRIYLDTGKKVTFLRIFCSMAISSREPPILDIQNRSIVVHMRKYFGRKIKRVIDEDAAFDLRTRLLKFSLQVRAGKVKLKTETAQEVGLKEIYDREDNPGQPFRPLGDRGLSIGISLLQCGLLWGDCNDTLLVLAEMERSTADEIKESKEGIVFSGLQGVVRSKMVGTGIDGTAKDVNDLGITIKEVSDQIYSDLEAQGWTFKDASDKDFKFKPQTCGRTIKHSLGIETSHKIRGSTITDRKFADKYENLCKKFGMRG